MSPAAEGGWRAAALRPGQPANDMIGLSKHGGVGRRPLAAAGVAALLSALLLVVPAGAQSPRYSLAVRGVGLDEALETFVDKTGLALAYDPALVRGRQAFCAMENAPAEEILRCLLADSDLDFYRLSSGTYVLTRRVELAPQQGFLSGTVRDRDTGEPLADAHVYLQQAGLGSVTNRSGQFIFPPLLPGRYALRVSYLGYQTWQDTLDVAPSARTRAEAQLQPEPILITPVVIDGLQQRLASEAAGEAAVGAATLTESPGRTQGDLHPLATLPGLSVDAVTASVHLQGGDAGAHQFRLDDVPVFLPRHLVGFIGPFNAFAIDRVTVHRAGFGAALGSHAAGVVAAEHAVEGREALDVQVDPLSFNARVRHTVGAETNHAVTVMAAARYGLWDVVRPGPLASTLEAWTTPDLFLYQASLARTEAASPVTQVLGDLPALFGPTNPSLHFSDLHGAARLRLGALRSLHASFYRGDSRLGGGVFSSLPLQTSGLPTFTVVDDYDWQNMLGQVRYQSMPGARTLFSLQARGSRYDLTHRYQILDTLYFGSSRGAPNLSSLSRINVRDGNHVEVLSLEGTADHAVGRHHLRVGTDVSRIRSQFDLLSVNLPEAEMETDLNPGDRNTYVGLDRASVTNEAARWWVAGYAEDAVSLSRRWSAEVGVRLTYRPERATVYAEPRLAMRYDREGGPLGAWSARLALGLYRQFINEFDVSKLNTGALLPAVRIWLPLDPSVRPPLTYHVAPSLLFTPSPGWAVRADAYYKYQPHGLAIRYLPAVNSGAAGAIDEQAQILTATRGAAYGGSVSFERHGAAGQVEARYEYSHADRRSPDLFGGRAEPVPWNEPHRVALSGLWNPARRLSLNARWQGVWGRAWGFRQAYYDYFGHDERTRYQGAYDLGRPSDHVLPPLYQLDVGAAYTHPVGPARLQLRLDLLNVLDRRNVADWRLVSDEQGLRREARHLYPRIPSAAVRLTF